MSHQPTSFEPPHWSKEPEEEHFSADYTVKLTDESTKVVAVYRVHKHELLKRSIFFNRFFQQSAFAESSKNEFTIPGLVQQAIDAFPALLNFLYADQRGPLTVKPANAAALDFFAGYFDIPTLEARVEKFFDRRMSFKDCETYLRDAVTFTNQKLKNRVAECCGRNIREINPSSKLLDYSDVAFWKTVYENVDQKFLDKKNYLALIAEFCYHKKTDSDQDALRHLTNWITATVEPVEVSAYAISVAAAYCILATEANVTTEGSATSLSPLQRKCVQALELNFSVMINNEKQTLDPALADFIRSRAAQRKKAAEAARKASRFMRFPKHVTVVGAGTSAVDGKYAHVADKGSQKYTKKGTWEGKPATFTLKRKIPDYDFWKIEAAVEGGPTHQFYGSYSFLGGFRNLPPTLSWWSGDGSHWGSCCGVEPAPELFYTA